MSILVPSSSGPGRLVLIQKIVGSTPTGITIFMLELPAWAFFLLRSSHEDALARRKPPCEQFYL